LSYIPCRTEATLLCLVRRASAILLALASAGATVAQTCAAPGWQGPATLSGTSIINTYHAGTGSPGAGSTSITVASATGQRSNTRALAAGDLIMIMQMQDSATPANAGLHEYAHVVAVSGATLQLAAPLVHSYVRAMSTSAVRNWQVIHVPQYSSATITGTVRADRWTISTATSDATGGVVVMDVAGSLAINGTITVAGAGFRGGAGISGKGNRPGGAYTDTDYVAGLTFNTINGGVKGEGIAGTPPVVFEGTATPVTYTATLGQGYAAGAGGRGAQQNAGGGGNDGNPPFGTPGTTGHQFNSGGGGGSGAAPGGRGGNAWNNNSSGGILNLPAGGNTGNEAGGLGGNAMTYSATRLVMGGGGGAGGANDGTASSIMTWPPTDTSVAANGAQGAITSSGAPGGGIVRVRAGSISAAGGVIDASGYRAYNKALNPPSDADSGGGGGGGGAVSVRAGTGSTVGLTIRATGGAGGSANHYNHGPGGGGGGGYVMLGIAGATVILTGGANGTDGCCGGATGNGSPKAYNSMPGGTGVSATGEALPAGTGAGASCLPVISVSKSTTTPTITTATGATATWWISLSNSGGAATNLFIFDAGLPPGWTYASSPATVYSYAPAPPPSAAANAAGAETVSATLPVGLPVTNASSINAATPVSLRANGSAPGVVPGVGNNQLTFGSFYLPQNGSITVSFTVSIPDTATAGTYHNGAGVAFLDPTRTAAGALRMVSPLVNVNANRTGTAYGANTTYQTGLVPNVAGAGYSGLMDGPSTENITLVPDLSVSKVAGTTVFHLGSAPQYIITGRNQGRAVANQIFANTQATDQSATAIVSSPVNITDTLPAGMTLTAVTNSNPGVWTCNPNGTSTTFTCSAGAGLYPLAAASSFVTITATTALSPAACPGPAINHTAITQASITESNTANNTATVSTPVGCSTELTVTKTNGASTVTAGGTTSYTVTFSNLGPAAANGALVSDAAGAGLSCTVGNCMASGGAICPAAGQWPNLLSGSIPLAQFPGSSSATFTVNCAVTATGM